MKGHKALKRAMGTKDAIRISGKIPLIVDTTEEISPERAQEILKNNKSNRPINWRKVEEYADLMARGEWKLHSQGIIIDNNGNLLTGQKRLWAIVYSGVTIPMRVSRGCPSDAANIIDRGDPQTARDLASRKTEKKHSMIEASIARGIAALAENMRPSKDVLGDLIAENTKKSEIALTETKGTKKTKSILMILAAIFVTAKDQDTVRTLSKHVEKLSDKLEAALLPGDAEKYWNKGAAFGLAMEHSRRIVKEFLNGKQEAQER
jgi:hypothetical protein